MITLPIITDHNPFTPESDDVVPGDLVTLDRWPGIGDAWKGAMVYLGTSVDKDPDDDGYGGVEITWLYTHDLGITWLPMVTGFRRLSKFSDVEG